MAQAGSGKRDPITSTGGVGGSASPKRSDLLNNKPRTTSAGSKGPNFTGKANPKTSWPVPDSPYGKGG